MTDFERRFEQAGDPVGLGEQPNSAGAMLSVQERAMLRRIEIARWFRASNVDERLHCVEMWATGLLKFATRDEQVGYAISPKGLAALH